MMDKYHVILLVISTIAFLTQPVSATQTTIELTSLEGFTYIASQEINAVDGVYTSQIFEYPSGDLSVRCEVIFTDGAADSRYAVLILCHGGVDGVTRRMRLKAVDLAEDGFLVVMPSYRGEDGSEGEIEVAAGEVDDVLACIELLRNCGSVDPDRIALIGSSHGALIAALAASRDPEIPAIVCAYGVMDIVGWWYYLQDSDQYEEDALSRRIYGGGPMDHPEEFARRSALRVACDIQPPVLLIQGDSDSLVPPEQSESLAQAFSNCGKLNFIYYLYPDVGHGFLWFQEGDINHRGESATETADRAWDDILNFIQSCWSGSPISESQ